MKTPKSNPKSRRDFLKGAITVSASVASAGVISACAPRQATKTPDVPAAGTPQAQSSAKRSWETPPAAIPDAQIKQTVTADVVVVGAGTAGMMTTFSAVNSGAKTILIEKSATFNCRGGQNGAIGTKVQKKAGIEIDRNQIVNDLKAYMGNRVDQRLLNLWADKSGEAYDLIIDMAAADGLSAARVLPTGIETQKGMNGIGYREYSTIHYIGGTEQKVIVGMLEKHAKEKGADIRYSTSAEQLIKNEAGRITGVIAKAADGTYIKFVATKGVVLATGDFGHNKEMIDAWAPWANFCDTNVFVPEVNTGDGHKMGLWAGAAMQDGPCAPMIHAMGSIPVLGSPFLRVNKKGERYENEDVPYAHVNSGALHQPGHTAFVVFDSKWTDEAPKMSPGFGQARVNENSAKDLQKAIDGKTSFSADTLEELAQKMGVPVEAFMATIKRYNELAKSGVDTDFGKRVQNLTTLEKGPYYAASIPNKLYVILGGLKINTNLQVLDANGNVIPGLYAVGNVSGDFFAMDYPTIAGGLSHGRCITFGYLAGKYIASQTA